MNKEKRKQEIEKIRNIMDKRDCVYDCPGSCRECDARAIYDAGYRGPEEIEILKKALTHYMGMYGCQLGVYKDEDYTEYSINGYVCDKDTIITVKQARDMCNFWCD